MSTNQPSIKHHKIASPTPSSNSSSSRRRAPGPSRARLREASAAATATLPNLGAPRPAWHGAGYPERAETAGLESHADASRPIVKDPTTPRKNESTRMPMTPGGNGGTPNWAAGTPDRAAFSGGVNTPLLSGGLHRMEEEDDEDGNSEEENLNDRLQSRMWEDLDDRKGEGFSVKNMVRYADMRREWEEQEVKKRAAREKETNEKQAAEEKKKRMRSKETNTGRLEEQKGMCKFRECSMPEGKHKRGCSVFDDSGHAFDEEFAEKGFEITGRKGLGAGEGNVTPAILIPPPMDHLLKECKERDDNHAHKLKAAGLDPKAFGEYKPEGGVKEQEQEMGKGDEDEDEDDPDAEWEPEDVESGC